MKLPILVLLFVSIATLAAAQTTTVAIPISVDILILPPTGDPLTVPFLAVRNTAISATSPFCNLAASPAGPLPLINPTLVEFDDPFTVGRECRVPMPIGLANVIWYRGVAVFKHAAPLADSDRSLVGVPPFDLVGIVVRHAPPTTVVVRP